MNQPIDCVRYLNQYTTRQSICQIGLNMYRLLASPKLPLDMTTAEAWIDILCSCVHGYICFHIAKHSLQYRKNQRNLPFTYPTLNKKTKQCLLTISPLWDQVLPESKSFMLGSYPATLEKVGGPTQVSARAWNNTRCPPSPGKTGGATLFHRPQSHCGHSFKFLLSNT
jgi:hypothetical protein